MLNKKSKDPEKSPQEQALEQQVEAMMNPELPNPGKETLSTGVATSAGAEPAAKLAASTDGTATPAARPQVKTAPPLAAPLRKQIPVSNAGVLPTAPLKIEGLDAVAGSVPASEDTVAADPTDIPTPEDSTLPTEVAADAPTAAADAAEMTETTEIPDESGNEDNLSDDITDRAVDDIVAQEGDIVLAVEDAKRRKVAGGVRPKRDWKAKLRTFFTDKRTWIALVVLLVAVFAVPVTRYKVLGLVMKRSVEIIVVDSKTAAAVSNAQITLGGRQAKTDGSGKAVIHAPLGNDTLAVEKQYYRTHESSYFVGFKKAVPARIRLVATGRLVPITVVNTITGQPLKEVEISVRGTTAKTDSKGKTSIALPATGGTADAVLKLTGYNTTKIKLTITDTLVKANNFTLTPAGHIYFLSNLNGTLDVVKANLDGSDRRTVLEGTGREEKTSTTLLASRDWRYLVLKAKRDGALPALHLIDTATDKVTTFDESNAEFTLIGWYGHNFMYDLTRNGVSAWQAGRQQLKSYDADNQQLNQLDQNQAEGDSTSYTQQTFLNYYVLDGIVAYNTQWYSYSAGIEPHDMTGKNDTIRAVQPNGQNKKDYQSFPTTSTGYIQAALYEPQGVYYAIYNNTDNKTTYYAYEDQSVKAVTVDQTDFNQGYPTYLISPSGKQTFWTELRDGKNTLFTGDAEAKHAKQIAARSEYTPYGWYADAYTLVSKNNSELYIMPVNGGSRSPVKITDYYKPAQSITGYGYGYGGL